MFIVIIVVAIISILRNNQRNETLLKKIFYWMHCDMCVNHNMSIESRNKIGLFGWSLFSLKPTLMNQ